MALFEQHHASCKSIVCCSRTNASDNTTHISAVHSDYVHCVCRGTFIVNSSFLVPVRNISVIPLEMAMAMTVKHLTYYRERSHIILDEHHISSASFGR